MVTKDDLDRIFGYAEWNTERLNAAMREFEIDTPLREAAFLAQIVDHDDCVSIAERWKQLGCNELADEENFHLITKLLSGGYRDYRERLKRYEKAKAVFY